MENVLWLLVGVVLGAVFIAIARLTGRTERLVFAVGLVVATLVYAGYAAVGGSTAWVAIEVLGAAVYGLFGWRGMNGHAEWLAAGWVLHPVWDVALHLAGPGAAFAPEWYTVNCISFDLLVAAYITWRFRETRAPRSVPS
ncbi:MAG: hypothetical protein IT168_24175 [Bryobacterales bacterium]|nr:hypothetical protein [Bryobacterales bacterium]